MFDASLLKYRLKKFCAVSYDESAIGHLSATRATLWLIALSFFYVNWIFGGKGDEFSAETLYFGVLFGLVFLLFVHRLTKPGAPAHSGWLLIHLILVSCAALTILWTPSVTIGIREAAGFFYTYMFHFLGRSLPMCRHWEVLRFILRTVVAFLLVSYAFVFLGMITGDVTFSLEEDHVISDTFGYFIVPIDLVSILLFFAFSLFVLGMRSLRLALVIILCLGMLLLNFSKTYMVSTAVALFFGWVLASKGNLKKLVRGLALFLFGMWIVLSDNTLSRQLFWDVDHAKEIMLTRPDMVTEVINSSGRFAIWDYVLERATQGAGGGYLGSGIGSAKHILYSNPWGGIGLASHSDYVRVTADFGYLGLCVYVFVLFAGGYYSWAKFQQATELPVRFLTLVLFMMFVYVTVGGIGYEFINRFRTTYLLLPFLLGMHWRLSQLKRSVTEFEGKGRSAWHAFDQRH